MRQQDVIRETAWKIKNWETKRQAYNLRPEHFGVALGQRSIHAQTSLVANEPEPAIPSLVEVGSTGQPTLPDENLWPKS